MMIGPEPLTVPVAALRGLGGIPKDRASVTEWLKRRGVPLHVRGDDGRKPEFVFLSDLPPAVQRAWRVREAERAGLPPGGMDDTAHTKLEARAPGIRDEAARRARIMAVVMRHRMAGRTWREVIASIPVETGLEAPCEGTLISWSKMIDGVDPVNWAPALAPDWRQDGRPKAPCAPEAWAFFERELATTGKNGTGPNMRRAHKRASEEAHKMGWSFPIYRTAHRHFQSLPVERQRMILQGEDAAVRSITTFQRRGVADLVAMQQVEVDFRQAGVWCTWEDGRIACPWVGIAVDRVSSRIVGWTFATSESEEAVFALINDLVTRHGIPGRIVQDNGSAFNGFRIMGGHRPLVRRKDKGPRNASWDVPGVYRFLEITPTNHGPEMAWAKLPESINSILRHGDNDPVFHRAQRSGPKDAPNPNPVPVDFALFRRVIEMEFAAINADTESRAKGLRKGECRNDAFERLSDGRFGREPTPLQKRWMGLKWDIFTVTGNGQVEIPSLGRVWGDGTTQTTMLDYAGKKVVVGIDPSDPAAPAMVYEWGVAEDRPRKMIVEALPAVPEARHNDEASKQRAKAEKVRAHKAIEAETVDGLEEHVEYRRAQVRASAGLPAPAPKPKVTQIPASPPFSSKPSVQQENDALRKLRNETFDRLQKEIDEKRKKKTG